MFGIMDSIFSWADGGAWTERKVMEVKNKGFNNSLTLGVMRTCFVPRYQKWYSPPLMQNRWKHTKCMGLLEWVVSWVRDKDESAKPQLTQTSIFPGSQTTSIFPMATKWPLMAIVVLMAIISPFNDISHKVLHECACESCQWAQRSPEH